MECFVVNLNNIEGRINPFYYKPEFYNLEKKLKSLKWEIVKLSDIFEINRGGSPRPINKFFTDDVNGVNWIKIGDTKNVDKYIYTTNQKIKPEGIKFSREVKEGDFILSNSMSFGRPYIMKTKGCIHDGWLLLREKDKNLNKEFLYCLLSSKFIFNFFRRATIGGVVENLNIDLVKEIKVPIPPTYIQNRIVELMDKAYSLKKSKETEAKQFIDSINNYLFDELGIKLQILIDKMTFIVNYEQIKTGRIDPHNFLHSKDTINSTKYKEKILNDVAILTKGKSITKDNIISGEYPVIAGGQTSPYSINKYNYTGNVITISSSGAYSGYVWYHKMPIFASDCTVIRSLDENICSTIFLYCVMKAKQKFIYNMQQGAGQPHVYSRDLSNIKIPLPPIDVQNKIAEEVKKRMHRAEQLQEEAKDIIEKAKQDIEDIILEN